MEEKTTYKNLGPMGFALGLIFGGGIWAITWIVTSTSFEIDWTFLLSQGIGVGVIIGTVSALGLIKELYGEKEWLVVPFGMGWGTLVGIGNGLVSAWTMDISYLDSFSIGASAGLITGVIIGTFLWMMVRKKYGKRVSN